ncbi:CIA30 family protein [Pelagibius litoralis]|uniref:CIA30 family protein n=1 Tax=Pelagibius litoralis TaxID=374515 RepID=A0A967EVP9_9PROT|nr:CIA30 family protein [Pelagibius litoralis]NIA68991.1 CIA30 family protein [Pelagibius litoralis]
MLIDDFSRPDLTSALGTRWRAVSDQVMGGVSEVSVERRQIGQSDCLHLGGPVRLDNNGGFIQAALDLSPSEEVLDASAYAGLRITVRGNGEVYALHLRSADINKPWQSYRASFLAKEALQTIDLPFADFAPHRLETALDVTRLRRVGLVAIGRAFQADLSLCGISFYR